MAHGARDWSNTNPGTVSHGLTDLAELGARLGSPSRVDRRGYVVFYDDFSKGLGAWEIQAVSPGSYVRLCTFPVVTGPFSVVMNGGTYTYGSAGMRLYLIPAMTDKIGFEWWWGHVSGDYVQEVYVDGIRDGVYYMVRVRYYASTYTLAIENLGGYEIPLITYPMAPYTPYAMHNAKVVLDLAEMRGERFIYDGREINIRTFPIVTSASSYPDMLRVIVTMNNVSGTNRDMYFDNFIYTMQED